MSQTAGVRLEARLDPDLSRWKWLVKWLLALPHVFVLLFLWVAVAVLTLVAGIAILFTRRFPRWIFDFNLGVMRWSWRVSYYAYSGGLGTDRYPPFSLGPEPDYPATLELDPPEELERWLPLVKWLLAIPQFIVVNVLAGTLRSWLTFFAAVALLFTGEYPRPMFDLIVGAGRWGARVGVYTALMTDRYPPFRLDQGGADPEAAVSAMS
jgi:hypothetical protein